MKLSQETMTILKNYAAINQSIQFKAGSVVKTKSGGADVYASAVIKEEFPCDFAIYELGRFLNVMSLFQDPELTFSEDNAVVIGDGVNSVRYIFADPSLISAANYEKEIKLPQIIATFDLKADVIAKLQKGAAVLGVPTVTISAKKGKLSISAHDDKNSSSDKFNLALGTTEADDFTVDLKLETIRFIPGDYTVDVTENIITRFSNTTLDLVYMVATKITR